MLIDGKESIVFKLVTETDTTKTIYTKAKQENQKVNLDEKNSGRAFTVILKGTEVDASQTPTFKGKVNKWPEPKTPGIRAQKRTALIIFILAATAIGYGVKKRYNLSMPSYNPMNMWSKGTAV